ncbi:hypothetical protein ACF3DV_29275 [Chlorogloeopsis fritschii PCC 9212]|uniref:Uncharacterized protein n=1 Tax=Chlorogloeopsis fritschii PCC 6912 TaxID=211165 RepID=A0A3S0YEW1_CHLFR|nr:hypothetical protein [Chlorogloeopsis fritschii]RUR83142.1 hypothetical protein PCC6912_25160 [Chlorogloeopsis fritschii PCC 6912]
MLRLYHVLLGGALLLLLPLGIKVVSPRLSKTNGMPQQPQTSSLTPKSNQGNIWKNILDQTTSPTGWQVAACDGNAPLMCVSANGRRLGTVEMRVYPLDKQQNFQNQLRKAGIEPDKNVDYQNPQYQIQVSTALNAWVNDYYTFLAKERQGSYGNRIGFSTHPPQKVQVGKLQGLSYGFTGLKVQGGVQEHHLGYVAFDGKNLYVIKTAFNPSLKTGKFDKLENLAIFEPYLHAIAANLRLP